MCRARRGSRRTYRGACRGSRDVLTGGYGPPDTLAGMGWDEFVLRPEDRAGASGRLVRTAHGTWFDPPLPVALVLIHPRPCRAQPLGQARHRRGAR
jgi:hypothetical protein